MIKNIWLSWTLLASLQMCCFPCLDLAHQYSVKFHAISPLKSPGEPLCWFTALLEEFWGSLQCWPPICLSSQLIRKLWDTPHWSPHLKTSSVLIPLLTVVCTAYLEIWPIITPCLFWRWGLGNILSQPLSWKIPTCKRGKLGNHGQRGARKQQIAATFLSETFCTNSTLSQILFTDLQQPRWQTLESLPKGIQAYTA